MQVRMCPCTVQDLDVDDASLVTGMLAPSRLSQLTQFVGLAGPPKGQVDEPSLTISSLQGLSMDDKVATLSALQPSTAAALLGMLYSHPAGAPKLRSMQHCCNRTEHDATLCMALGKCSLITRSLHSWCASSTAALY